MTSPALKPTHHPMLSAMAEMGAGKEILATLLEFSDSALSKEHLQFLKGPIVIQQSQWMDIVPDWLLQQIIPERIDIILSEHEAGKIGWRVGPAEITATIMPACMDAPMPYELSEIYLWASACAVAKRDNRTAEEVWHSINNHPFPENDITKSGGRYFYDYQRISSDIRRAVIRQQQKRERKRKPINQPNLFTEDI